MIQIPAHYSVAKIESLDELRELFTEATRFDLNWLVCSTSGVHGSYATLDQIEECLEGRGEYCHEADHEHDDWLTVLVIQPRLVALRYGQIQITRDDIPFLRAAVSMSLQGMVKSQDGNTLAAI
jgi:hypothetical protein